MPTVPQSSSPAPEILVNSKPDELATEFQFTDLALQSEKLTVKPSEYIIDRGLHRAVEVAIMLKQPLLLTGEPGTGKTRLAEKLASDLYAAYPKDYLPDPLVFHTKTVSSYTDLFYFYDALSHFHDAHLPQHTSSIASMRPKASDYIYLQAMGQAIVLSNKDTAHSEFPYKMMMEVEKANILQKGQPSPRSSVVLIDEVDKAPRDFTNDLLNELDRYEFYVKEDFNMRFKRGTRNIFLLLTSNSEKNLPEAFLRRCIFYHLEFPGDEQLLQIVKSQLFAENSESENDATPKIMEFIQYFGDLRKRTKDKKPATAELIAWIQYLKGHIMSGIGINAIDREVLLSSFSILAKDKFDLDELKKFGSQA